MMNRLKTRIYAQRIATFVAVLFAFCSLSAQNVFTGHLAKTSAGEGRVLVVQDAEIEALVNGTRKEVKLADAESSDSLTIETDVSNDSLRTGKPLIAKPGYRIQLYSGGNSRDHKLAAEKVQAACRKIFPELSTYVSFISPRWTCRVGNFSTQKAAEKYMTALRESGQFKTLILVRCKIVVRE